MTTLTSSRRRTRSTLIASGFAALALFASACSGGTSDGDDKKTDSGSGSNSDTQADSGKSSDDAAKRRKCMREHGLDVPDPKPGEDERGLTIGGDMDKDKMEKAMKACSGGKGGLSTGGGVTQADKDQALKFAQCMRKNGYNMPDPKFDGSMSSAMKMPEGAELKKFEKANKACASVGR